MKNLYIVSISILFTGLAGCSGIPLPESASGMNTGAVRQSDGSYIHRLMTHSQTMSSLKLLNEIIEKDTKICESTNQKMIIDKSIHKDNGEDGQVWPYAKVYFRCVDVETSVKAN